MSAGLLAFFIALFCIDGADRTGAGARVAGGMVDLPGPRKVHLQPIPLLGGLAMYGGVMLAIIFAFDGAARAQSVGIVTGATLVAAVGFLDDRGWLHHQIKLFVGMPLAACILLASGIHAQAFELVLPGRVGYALDAHSRFSGWWRLRLRSAYWTTWMAVRRCCGDGVVLFRDSSVFERSNCGVRPWLRRFLSGRGLSALEF